MEEVVASAPGKAILFGEHAVVYGHPAVALAIGMRTLVTVRPTDEPGVTLNGDRLRRRRHPHVARIVDHLWDRDLDPGIDISIEGDLPSGAGLGSSAALAVAVAGALRAARGRWVTEGGSSLNASTWLEGYASDGREPALFVEANAPAPHIAGPGRTLLRGAASISLDEASLLAHVAEAASQRGRASPIDSATSAFGQTLLISDQREPDAEWMLTRRMPTEDGERAWDLHRLPLPAWEDGLALVIGSTGVHASTSDLVAGVARRRRSDPSIDQALSAIGALVRRGMAALRAGDAAALGHAMSENHLLLRHIGVSSPELEDLVAAAGPTSLGAKLTGAGGGGCMMALTRDATATSAAIEAAGGTTWTSPIGVEGLRLE